MKPMLAAIAGPLRGSSFPLGGGTVTIGRDLSNSIVISDASVSRKHSTITGGPQSYRITDAESLNGTIVNGVPVRQQGLQHGDQIEIGNSLFVVLLEPEDLLPVPSPAPVSPVRVGSTMRLRPGQALYGQGGPLRSHSSAGLAAESGRLARDLGLLLKASRVLPSSANVAELGKRLIELALEEVPADRGALFLRDRETDVPAAVLGRPGAPESDLAAPFSRTVLDEVTADRQAILSNDILEEKSLAGSESLAGPRIRALAAAPLLAGEKVEAILYLDTRGAGSPLGEPHLQLLMGLANIASACLESVRRVEWLESERRLLAESSRGPDMVGESAEVRQVREFVARVAPEEVTVLILGESGTGKEMAARAIHAGSPRAGRPFLAINCASLSETLLESELFGHERGAFTGAIAQKKGRLEVADGGTVFLDEVGELPLAVQARLLRFLQEKEFERVGGTRTIRVNVRLLAATNQDLREAIGAGRFREDLFYRLNVVALTLPPLRGRREDIPLLATCFAARFARKFNKKTRGISPAARVCLSEYDWPGNIRELSNAIERAVVLGHDDLIAPEDLPESILESAPAVGREDANGGPAAARYTEAVNAAKRDVIRKAVKEAGGRYTEAARKLGIHPNYLHRLIRNLDMKTELKS
jgi:transcriptional regulator with GAF, ATPase, and Fis domain